MPLFGLNSGEKAIPTFFSQLERATENLHWMPTFVGFHSTEFFARALSVVSMAQKFWQEFIEE